MNKKLLIAIALSSALMIMTACNSNNATKTAETVNNNTTTLVEEKETNYPLYSDLSIEPLDSKGINGLQEVKITNNSSFPIFGITVTYKNNDINVEDVNAIVSDTLLPGESGKEEIFSADNNIKEITGDFKPVKITFTFLDSEKHKYMLNYDVKTELYDIVQYE